MSRAAWIATIVVVGVVVLGAAFVGTALATDRPGFCDTCHEMGPYHAAWAKGPHAEVWCIDCHVDQGLPARFGHKFVALKELYAHVTGDTTFPRDELTPIPSERCIRCHEDASQKADERFDHTLHASKGECVDCHFTVGHEVTEQALRDAGIFNPNVTRERLKGELAAVGGGVANLDGHVDVTCSSCHDMAATPCASCHEAPGQGTDDQESGESEESEGDDEGEGAKDEHPQVGDRACSLCHQPGEEFVFTHPKNPKDCTECHSAPADDHPSVKGSCTQCHKYTGTSWKFTHPSKTSTCTTCHKAPAKGHPSVKGRKCTTCHKKAGTSWAFSHASLGSNCASCHNAPGGKHPSSGNCTSCHRSGGSSWAFRHGSAGGEHSYRSFACAKCHPSSYSRVSCTCHGGGRPTDD